MRQHVIARQQALLDLVRERGSISVRELADRLQVHVVTIRRDLDQLAEAGQIERRHGHVEWPGTAGAPAPGPAGSGPTLGMVVPVRDYYFGEIIKGVRVAAAERGAHLLLMLTEYDAARDSPLIMQLLDAGVDGLILTPSKGGSALDDEVIKRLAAAATPIVILERPLHPGHPLAANDAVYADHRHGVAQAIRYLHEQGRDKIAMMTRQVVEGDRYLDGYLMGMETLGLKQPIQPMQSRSQYEESKQFVSSIRAIVRAANAGKLDAIVIQNDESAIEVARALSHQGIRIPDDVAIIAYDDEVAEFAETPLTAVAPPKRAVGQAAVEMLTRRISEVRSDRSPAERTPICHQAMLPTLTIRRSTP